MYKNIRKRKKGVFKGYPLDFACIFKENQAKQRKKRKGGILYGKYHIKANIPKFTEHKSYR